MLNVLLWVLCAVVILVAILAFALVGVMLIKIAIEEIHDE